MLLDRLIGASIGLVPKSIVRRIAKRYVAGETLGEAVATLRQLEAEGCCFTLDLLGEFVKDEAESDATAAAYQEMLQRIDVDALDGNISIKLTAFGLMLDEERCYARVERVVKDATERGLFVRLDMEDSPWTDATFRIYQRLRDAGYRDVGLVLQAYLHRTVPDVKRLSELQPSYRLCKGIYVEPEEIAYQDDQRVREAFVEALESMVDGGASRVGIATHDDWLVERAEKLIADRKLTAEHYEFQMLHGVRPELRKRLLKAGHRVRIYVPFGQDWYGYCVRRLKENPKIGRYVFLAMLGLD